MKISCTTCSARYTVDDTKLGGRTVELRCKRCGAAMVARATPLSPVAVGAREESSVLFSLSSLRELTSSAPSFGGPSKGTASGEGSGLIDIRQLSALAAPTARTSVPTLDLLLSVPALSSSPLSAPIIAVPSRSGAGPRLGAALAALGAAAALVLMGVGFVASGRANAVEIAAPVAVPVAAVPVAAVPVAAVPVAATVAAVPVTAVDAETVPDPVAPIASVSERVGPPTTPPARTRIRVAERIEPTPLPTPSVTTASTARPSMEDLVARATDPEARTDAASAPPATRLPETPSRDEVRDAMESLTPAIRACAGGTHGRALVSVVVSGATGHGRSARVGGDFSDTPAATCIERVARDVELAPFSRATFTISFPFSL